MLNTDTALTAPPQNYCAQWLFSKHYVFFWHVRAKKDSTILYVFCVTISFSLGSLSMF